MTIKTKLLSSILAITILISFTGFFVYQATEQIEHEIGHAEIAAKIVQTSTTRRGLVLDYYRFHEERPKAQWQLLADRQTQLTQSEVFQTDSEHKASLTEIQETSEQVNLLFAKIVANYEKPKSNSAERALSQELEEVLVSQLLAKTQINITRAYALSDVNLANVQTAEQMLVFAVGASVAILILFLVALLFFFNQFIAKPLIKLKEAATRIASLDFSSTTTTTITTGSGDEIGALGQAFNVMISKLKESYSGLEKQVQSRTAQLEEKMAESEKMNDLMVGRELKMVELKKEIAELKGKPKDTHA
ncbi:MAG: HAMP domain-containing protein [bacterium]|nr:HAMP domain-containing protein [bacterium]